MKILSKDLAKKTKIDGKEVIKDFANSEDIFDIIYCDNVIEHVRAPVMLISQLLASLSEGGTLIIKTPAARNTEMYFCPLVSLAYVKRALTYNGFPIAIRSLLSPYWHCEPPRHLYGFGEASLLIAAQNSTDELLDISLGHYRIGYWSNTCAQRSYHVLK